MKKRSTYYATNPFLVWPQLALKTNEMLIASAQVINHRTTRMALAGVSPNARDRKEFTLMGQEKLEAATESLQAMTTRMMTTQVQLGTLMFEQYVTGVFSMFKIATTPALIFTSQGHSELFRSAASNSRALGSHLSHSAGRLAHEGLKPIHSRATGNAKRLLKL